MTERNCLPKNKVILRQNMKFDKEPPYKSTFKVYSAIAAAGTPIAETGIGLINDYFGSNYPAFRYKPPFWVNGPWGLPSQLPTAGNRPQVSLIQDPGTVVGIFVPDPNNLTTGNTIFCGPHLVAFSNLLNWMQRLNTFHGWGLPKFQIRNVDTGLLQDFDPEGVDDVVTIEDYTLYGEPWHYYDLVQQVINWWRSLARLLGVAYWEELINGRHYNRGKSSLANKLGNEWLYDDGTVFRESVDYGKYSYDDFLKIFPFNFVTEVDPSIGTNDFSTITPTRVLMTKFKLDRTKSTSFVGWQPGVLETKYSTQSVFAGLGISGAMNIYWGHNGKPNSTPYADYQWGDFQIRMAKIRTIPNPPGSHFAFGIQVLDNTDWAVISDWDESRVQDGLQQLTGKSVKRISTVVTDHGFGGWNYDEPDPILRVIDNHLAQIDRKFLIEFTEPFDDLFGPVAPGADNIQYVFQGKYSLLPDPIYVIQDASGFEWSVNGFNFFMVSGLNPLAAVTNAGILPDPKSDYDLHETVYANSTANFDTLFYNQRLTFNQYLIGVSGLGGYQPITNPAGYYLKASVSYNMPLEHIAIWSLLMDKKTLKYRYGIDGSFMTKIGILRKDNDTPANPFNELTVDHTVKLYIGVTDDLTVNFSPQQKGETGPITFAPTDQSENATEYNKIKDIIENQGQLIIDLSSYPVGYTEVEIDLSFIKDFGDNVTLFMGGVQSFDPDSLPIAVDVADYYHALFSNGNISSPNLSGQYPFSITGVQLGWSDTINVVTPVDSYDGHTIPDYDVQLRMGHFVIELDSTVWRFGR